MDSDWYPKNLGLSFVVIVEVILYQKRGFSANNGARIYICHKCNCPTYFDLQNRQTPGSILVITLRTLVMIWLKNYMMKLEIA